MPGHIRIGVDTGGTFTDLVAYDEAGGTLATTKTPSTPADPSTGVLAGIDKILGQLGRGPGDVASVSHGTTVATNALLAEDFGGLGFLTTEGFRHVLEIARQSVPDSYGNSYFWVKPERIVPVDLVHEIPGRLAADGRQVRPLDLDAVRQAARHLRARDVTAVGICFLHAYANPDHEQQARDAFLAEFPGCAVSISSDVLREYREYERSVTTLVDAFVKPRVAAYLSAIADRLAAYTDRPVPFMVMKSNGGVMSAAELAKQPISTILSGPAAGALGAGMLTRAAGFDRVLTLDGGGTSTDVAVVTDGQPGVTTEGTVGRFPTKVPMVDVVTVGTGGGSVAWIPRDVSPPALKVGPRSAGAEPGPLCYSRGGTEPTVTDAHLLLGRLPPRLLGGEIPLDLAAARDGLEKLAQDVGMDVHRCAAGVLEIAAWNQANAIRRVTVKRGHDVRDFVLATIGGSGPLLACRLVDVLGLRAALVPASPGTVSAFGLLTVDVRKDDVQTWVRRHDDVVGRLAGELAGHYDALADRARGALRAEGFADADQRIERAADLRYYGQASEVRVAVPPGPVGAGLADTVVQSFHDAHERRYGYCYRDDPDKVVEWVNLRITGIGPVHTPALPTAEPGDGDASGARTGSRRLYADGAWHDSATYAREGLRGGDVVRGPAVVEEYGSTLPLLPGFRARVDDQANLIVEKEDPAR